MFFPASFIFNVKPDILIIANLTAESFMCKTDAGGEVS